jgi:hypothetical protein
LRLNEKKDGRSDNTQQNNQILICLTLKAKPMAAVTICIDEKQESTKFEHIYYPRSHVYLKR